MRAGALLMVDLPGPVLEPPQADFLRANGLRAVCLFRRNMQSGAQLRQLCADLRAVLGEEALIAADQEGGAVVRSDFWPYPPSALTLGAAGDPPLTRAVAAASARFLRSVGLNWNFAPVLDVNVNPLNPVIGDRAYGREPGAVTAHGLAFAAGLADAGVAACAKHFPGHGDTAQDSHLALPTVDKPSEELERTELAPFRAAVRAGVPALMTAHIVFPALDPQHPATLSRAVLTGLLREQWGYGGVVITDSMGMQAIDGHWGRGPAAVRALRAGADMVMALGSPQAQQQTLDAVQAALDAGQLKPEASLRRLSELARQYPAAARPHPEREADAALLEHAWARGLSTVGAVNPPAPGSAVLLVARREEAALNVSEAGLRADTLYSVLSGLYQLTLREFDDPAQLDWPALRLEAGARGAALLLATTARLRAPFPGIHDAAPDLHLCLYNPCAVLDVPAPALVTGGFRPEALRALRAVLAGERAASGRLPFP